MNEELAKRAVACKRWRWMAGMRTTDGDRMFDNGWPKHDTIDVGSSGVAETIEWSSNPNANALPDFNDPATLGCLLALVREARNDPTLYAHPYGQGWRWRSNYRDCTAIYGSEIEALVAALEAAP